MAVFPGSVPRQKFSVPHHYEFALWTDQQELLFICSLGNFLSCRVENARLKVGMVEKDKELRDTVDSLQVGVVSCKLNIRCNQTRGAYCLCTCSHTHTHTRAHKQMYTRALTTICNLEVLCSQFLIPNVPNWSGPHVYVCTFQRFAAKMLRVDCILPSCCTLSWLNIQQRQLDHGKLRYGYMLNMLNMICASGGI